MTTLIDLTPTPVQVTNGQQGAHITVDSGRMEYADAADSAAWHKLAGSVLEVRPPVVVFIRSGLQTGAEVVVTSWTESAAEAKKKDSA